MTFQTAGILVVACLLAAMSQLLLKLGVGSQLSLKTFSNAFVIIGLALYFFGSVLWLYGLSRAPMSAVYPFTMLTFVLVGVASIFVLGERPSSQAIAGWGIICGGIAVVYLGT